MLYTSELKTDVMNPYKKKNYKGLKVIKTHHAGEKLEGFNIPFKTAVYMLMNGIEVKPHKIDDKKKKWGEEDQREMRYVEYGNYLFTFKIKPNQYDLSEDVIILVTVTNTLVNFHKLPDSVDLKQSY